VKDSNEKSMWGQVEKLGEGIKANYDPDKKIITFCFNRNSQSSSELLRTLRKRLIKELRIGLRRSHEVQWSSCR
jgi:hypothetical protein